MAVGVFLSCLILFHVTTRTTVSAACPDGKWGPNCGSDCHCLGGGFKCDQVTAACDSNVCEAGYLNPPTCQTACDPGYFGSGCELTCHCVNDEVCNNVNGYCQNGCDPKYTGAGCLQRRTFLGSPPRVTNVTCDRLRVTWPQWSATNPVDASDIHTPVTIYQLEVKVNESGWASEGQEIPMVANQGTYEYAINNLNKYNTYSFRVRADGQSQYNKRVRGYPGPASDPVKPSCSVPGPVSDPVVAVISHQQIRLSWKAPSTGGVVDNYILTYRKIGIGRDSSCQNVTGSLVTRTLASSTLAWDIDNLDAWSHYQINLRARNALGDGENTQLTSNTLETGPTGKVSGLRSSDVTSSSFLLQWDPLPCLDRQGALTKYLITLTGRVTFETTNTQYTVENLNPSTAYTAYVQFFNQHASTTPSDTIRVTTLSGVATTQRPQTVPGAPQNLQVDPRTSSMMITWLAPEGTNLGIQEYQVEYKITTADAYTKMNVQDVTATITGLQQGATYQVRVRARNVVGWGPYTAVVTRTLPSDRPSAPSLPSAIAVSSRTATVRWFAPANPNGNIVNYQVTYVRTNTAHVGASNLGTTVTVPSTTTSLVLNNLDPSSTYRVTIRASNANGYGDASKALEIITYPAVPADPKPPIFASDAQTSSTAVLKIYSVESDFAYVDIFSVKVTARRKRAADCTTNGRLQMRVLKSDFATTEKEVILGDDKVYNGIGNSPLDANTKYEACIKATSAYRNRESHSYAKSSNTVSTIERVPTDYTWLIILIVVLLLIIIIVIIIIVVILLLRRRRQKQQQNTLNKTWLNYYSNNYERFDDSLPRIQPYGRWSDITSFNQPRHVEHVREPLEPVDPKIITVEEEYHNLPKGQQHPCLKALAPENDIKNRFEQFLPYDHTLVNVQSLQGGNLYVNANYIDGFQKPRAYIAAQSPFDGVTVDDFWEMIYQDNCQQVVMLCVPIEDGILKCEQYWPDQGTRIYRDMAVTLKGTESFTHYTIRHFDLTPQKHFTKTKHVSQFQYTAWPAHGIPHDPIPYLEFVIKIRTLSMPGAGPQVVHCGTGVSRTGVHIAVDSLIKEGMKNGEISVYNFCERMRDCRTTMVRTPSQYTFIYDTLFEALMTSDYILDFDMRNTYKRLLLKNNRTGRTELLEQFKILRYYSPQIGEDRCRAALKSQNRSKNRYLNILPPDDVRVTIRTPGGLERNDYINAIFLDGHVNRKVFIVTQTPMLGTCIDFWKLVYDYKIKTIVMLHDKTFKEENIQDYWPKGNEMKRFDPFFVTLKSSVKEKDFVVKRYFDLSNSMHRNEKTREVMQFQLFSGWHQYDKIPDRDAILQLVDSVLDQQRRLEEDEETTDLPPILVHCADGATRSGLFCALMTLIEKMKYDRYVDVFHTVRHLKRARPQFIDDFEQYKMCFKALWEHVNTRFKSNYSLSRISKGSHETLDSVGSTKETALR